MFYILLSLCLPCPQNWLQVKISWLLALLNVSSWDILAPRKDKCWNPLSRRYVVSAYVTFFEGMSFFTSVGATLDVDVLTPTFVLPLPIPLTF